MLKLPILLLSIHCTWKGLYTIPLRICPPVRDLLQYLAAQTDCYSNLEMGLTSKVSCKRPYLDNGIWSHDDCKQSWNNLAEATHVPHITEGELQAGKAGQENPALVLASAMWSAHQTVSFEAALGTPRAHKYKLPAFCGFRYSKISSAW